MTNRDQNREFNSACRKIGRVLGRDLTADEEERLHREISGKGFDYDEIVEIGLALFLY